MSCGSISAQGSCSGVISSRGCCPSKLYGPFSSGIQRFTNAIGAAWWGSLPTGGGGGGGWTGDFGFGGDGDVIGDDGGGGNWWDGDANFGGDGDTIGDDGGGGNWWDGDADFGGDGNDIGDGDPPINHHGPPQSGGVVAV